MSTVPKSRRTIARTEYVHNAAQLFSFTLDCVMKLPKRWTFLLSERTVDAAAHVLEHAKSANSIYVTCAIDAQLRHAHLQEAYCAAQVLSSYVDEIYHRVPVRADGKACISEHLYLAWVESIDREFTLLKGVMHADRKKWSSYLEEAPAIPEAGAQLSFIHFIQSSDGE